MAKAVRGGVRLESGTSADLIALDTTIWGRIKAFGRRAVRSVRLPFSNRLDSHMRSAVGSSSLALLASRIDEIKFLTDVLLQRTDFLLQRRAVQLAEREVLVRTLYGWLIVPTEDEVLLTAMLEGGGVLEPGTTQVLTRLVHEGDTVIDVGANIGLLTVPAARRVGSTGKVIAVEPLPRLANLLQRSMHINGVADRVKIEACAAAAESGAARIHVAKILGHSSLLPVESEVDAFDVMLRPLDEMLPPKRPVALVKIDAEGYEPHVWRGMQRIISENPDLAVIIEFGPSHLQRAGVSIQEWLDEFLSPGFRAYEIDEETGRCKPLRKEGLAEVFSVNLLLLRRPERSYPEIEFE